MLRRTALVLALAGAGLAGVVSPVSAGTPTMCRNTYGGDVISADGVSCARARDIVRTWAVRYQRDGEPTRRVGRFDCQGWNSSVEGLVIRCKRSRDGARIRWYANVPA